jgi:hypothetical protein
MEQSARAIVATGKWTRITAWSLGVLVLIMFVIGF